MVFQYFNNIAHSIGFLHNNNNNILVPAFNKVRDRRSQYDMARLESGTKEMARPPLQK